MAKIFRAFLILILFIGAVQAELEGSIRLVDGSEDSEGRVEIFHNSVWGTVCDDAWGMNDARVVCRQLGYEEAEEATSSARFGGGEDDQPIFMDNVDCTGSEVELADCDFWGWGDHNCQHSEDAGVRCSDPEEGRVRLVNGKGNHQGRVEIFHDGVWGVVCDDYWDIEDAQVVCRQLGYHDAVSAESSAYFGQASGATPILLDNVFCTGDEDRLTDCNSNSWGTNDCSHSEDAGVICTHEASEGEIRVEDGSKAYKGRVEIYHGSQWGTICNYGWDSTEEEVTCRQLGYQGVSYLYNTVQDGDGPIHLSYLGCLGSEEELTDCPSTGWGNVYDCTHYQDVDVECEEYVIPAPDLFASEGDVRLVGGATSRSGRVEIYHRSQWGTVCDESWSYNDAEVVCRQLGYESVSSYKVTTSPGFGPIHLSDPGCYGYESQLSSCVRDSEWNINTCDHSQDVGVECSYYEVEESMEGWLIAVIVVSSLVAFSFILILISAVCSSKNRKVRRTGRQTVAAISGNVNTTTTTSTSATQQGAVGYPTQPTATNMAPPPSYTAVVYAAGSSGVQVPHMTQYAPYPSAVQQNTIMAPQASATTVPTVVDANSKGAVPIQ
ncbi:scavenger receptor cysteine-rich domain superfamily protein-like [Diadema setosum]|uniref:scavenger receptor cysteine-rich domain superfamily protein-like n=1 Tax=Diadema setosum TaxID=31175 RepID=UPI003B3B9210